VREAGADYLAIRFRRDRLNPTTATQIETTMPSRVQYLDCLDLSMALLP
jgi:hypothetical protein